MGTKIHCSRVGATSANSKVFASLDIDVAPGLAGQLLLEETTLVVDGGRAETVDPDVYDDYPITCHPGDRLSHVYTILPDLSYTTAGSSGATSLSLTCLATILTTDNNRRPLRIRSTTNTDLPRFSAPQDLTDLLTVTVSGPSTVSINSTLIWSLLLANHTSTQSFDLVLSPILASSPTTSAPLVPITPDVLVSELAPGASATAEMRFVVLGRGVLKVDSIRMSSKESRSSNGNSVHIDIPARLLPDILVLDEGS